MKISYKKEVDHNYMMIQEEGLYRADYQIRQMTENVISGLLKVRGKGMDGISCYDYEIGGKVSMKTWYEKQKLNFKELEQFLYQLKAVLQNAREYMLDVNRILLDPEYIYYEKGWFYFCYYPLWERTFEESFHKLTEYFVSSVDYQDKKAIYLSYELHKVTMSENYSLQQVMELIHVEEEKKEEVKESELEKDVLFSEEEVAETAQILRREGKKKKHRKRQKWGDFEALYIEEDDL